MAFDHHRENEKRPERAVGETIMGLVLDTVGKLIAGYLQKPYRFDELVACIRRVIG